MKRTLIAVVFIASLLPSFGQDDQQGIVILTLDDCIQMALDNNLGLKRTKNNLIMSRSNKTAAVLNFLPSINASADYGINEGASFDSNSGNFVTSTLRGSSPSVSGQLILFNAFANHHLLNRRQHEYNSSIHAINGAEIDVKANIVLRYLNVMLDVENLKNSTQRVELLKSQLVREEKRQSVGVGNLETVYNFRSQVANEKLTNVNLVNQYQMDLLALQQLIQYSEQEPFELADTDVRDEFINLGIDPFDKVLAEVLEYSYNIKQSQESNLAAADILKQTRSSRFPTLSAYGQLGTRYSNQNVGEFFEQYDNYQYKSFGLSLSIPIFNGYQAQNSIDEAKVNLLNSELSYKQTVQDVTNSIQNTYLNLVSAVSSYESASENYKAQLQTFEFMKKRFETGNTDFYTYLESLNNKNRAELELVNAKYSIVFRQKILELYRGSDASVN